MKKIIIIFVIAFTLYGCASQLYQPSTINVQKAQQVNPGITLGQMKAARNLYVTTCSSCHYLHLPDEFTSARWLKVLDKMQPKAKISDKQKKLLFTYLTSE